MSDHEPQHGELEHISSTEDFDSSNVVDIKPLLDIRSNVAREVDNNGKEEAYLVCRRANRGIDRAFEWFEELMIDTEPLRRRINYAATLDLSDIIAHMNEYLEAIVRASEMQQEGIPLLAVHPYRLMSDAALKYADELKNPARCDQFYRFYEWLTDDDTCTRIVKMGMEK